MGEPTGKPADIWHVCFVVDDIARAAEEFRDVLGVTFPPPHVVPVRLERENGSVEAIDVRVAFSGDSRIAIELIEAAPGTILSAPAGTAFHHMGYWTDDIEAVQARISDRGISCLAIPRGDDPLPFFLHAGPAGIMLEPCSLSVPHPGLEHYYPATVTPPPA